MREAAVRRAVPDDWRAFRDLRLAGLGEAPDAFGSTLAQEAQIAEEGWRRRLARSACFIVSDGGRDVGVAAGIAEEGGAEMVSMWLDPEHRGRGLADLLVQAVVAWARAAGFRQLHLWVSNGNDRASGLYRRHGFVATGESQPVREENPGPLESGMVLTLSESG